MAKAEPFCNRAEAFEAHDDIPLSPADQESLGDVIQRRYSRRDMVRGSLGVVAAAALFGPAALAGNACSARGSEDRFAFEEIAAGVDETHHLAPGYRADILLRWGDPLFADRPRSTRAGRARPRN
jgi:uncharacterized protein